MLRVVKTAMQLCALMVSVAIGVALRALMPNVTLGTAVFSFLVLGLVFLFAVTLVISSLLIGSAPGRSKLGQMLNNKVSKQTEGSGELYERARRTAAKRGEAEPEAAMPTTQADSKGR